jgi:hypothetical protein
VRVGVSEAFSISDWMENIDYRVDNFEIPLLPENVNDSELILRANCNHSQYSNGIGI